MNERKLKIGIVGGGMSGLVLAQLLSLQSVQCDLDVTIFERDQDKDSRHQGTWR